MKNIIVATKNRGKLREIEGLLGRDRFNIMSLFDCPDIPEIVEDGNSFAENAFIKAKTASSFRKDAFVIGEDSGLEVDYLKGDPGIFSARFSGEEASDEDNNKKLIKCLQGVEFSKRTARYQCYIAVLEKGKEIMQVNGVCEGVIVEDPRGSNGFGYDPYFFVEEYGETFGEMDPMVKSKISHRAKAFQKLKDILINNNENKVGE